MNQPFRYPPLPSPRLRRSMRGFSLLELLAVITLISILAVIILPRIGIHGQNAKAKVCDQYVSDLNAAIERYRFDHDAFPASLTDLQPDYYPEAIPVCPSTGAAYTIDPVTHAVVPHSH